MRRQILFVTLLFCPAAFGEHLLSVGLKGGFPLTDSLSDSASKNYLIGPMAELNLPFGLAVEADALYRPLTLTTSRAGDTIRHPHCAACLLRTRTRRSFLIGLSFWTA